jgi:competence ComEA-like helix-hairpin-helix protein
LVVSVGKGHPVIPWLERHRGGILIALAAAVVIGLVFLFLQHREGRQPLEIRLDQPTITAKTNINTADARTLDSLPGIGEVYSQRIVDSRTANGPFASTDDLLQRKIIPRATFEKIKDLITVGP